MKKARTLSSDRQKKPSAVVVLDFEHRQKHRFLATLADGSELGVHLPRGSVLADGDRLETEDGELILVRAAAEGVSVARAAEPLLFARLAYHLGNRHVALQIEPGKLSYLHDHVLDDLARRLGAEVSFEELPFCPESGAYGGHAASEHHHHEPDHSHGHQHSHARIHHHSNGTEH